MRSTRLPALFAVLLLLAAGVANAQEIRSFYREITVRVSNKDIVSARNNALYQLRSEILKQAIEELVDPVIVEENRQLIFKTNPLKPSMFLTSVKVLKEEVKGNNFTMELQGNIHMANLTERLREKKLILKDDPVIKATFLMEKGIELPHKEIQEKLVLYHIESRFDQIDAIEFPYDQRNEKEFVASLFERFPKNPILFLAETIPDEDPSRSKGVSFRIFRQQDKEQIVQFFLMLAQSVEKGDLRSAIRNNQIKLFSLFSLRTLDLNAFQEGEEAFYSLKVTGMSRPYHRFLFEKYHLKPLRQIQSFQVGRISNASVFYRIVSNSEKDRLLRQIKKNKEYFEFIEDPSSDENEDVLVVGVIPKIDKKIVEVNNWSPQNFIVEQIQKTMEIDGEEVEEFIPLYEEVEPNNNSQEFNKIPESAFVLGKISSRADEDIFMIQAPEDKTRLLIQWYRIGKTDLSPQLRLYDGSFTFLNNYFLIGSEYSLEVEYEAEDTETQDATSGNYIRVSDRIGFIPGETGGFKSYYYLLRYQWE